MTAQDPTNLQAKLQKHQVFEEEVTAYRPHVESIREAGQTLVEAGHYASETIQACLTDIGELWNELDSKMKYKGKWAEHMGWAKPVYSHTRCIGQDSHLKSHASHMQVTCTL